MPEVDQMACRYLATGDVVNRDYRVKTVLRVDEYARNVCGAGKLLPAALFLPVLSVTTGPTPPNCSFIFAGRDLDEN